VSKSKNNSIIFLTTLSVYLGLVLVGGAAPHVLAQAALTQAFEITDEIEATDDIDRKPDEDTSADVTLTTAQDSAVARSVDVYLSQFKRFVPVSDFAQSPIEVFAGTYTAAALPYLQGPLLSTLSPVRKYLTVSCLPRASIDLPRFAVAI
jgi:hypothetical protein